MALGMSRARNWGVDQQRIALSLAVARKGVAYRVTPCRTAHGELRRCVLWLTPSKGGITLPFVESTAVLCNIRHGRWEARAEFDGRVLAKGISERDVIRATIEAVWH